MNFTHSRDGHDCVVQAQPMDEREQDLMEQLMPTCPRHAVRDDGDGL